MLDKNELLSLLNIYQEIIELEKEMLKKQEKLKNIIEMRLENGKRTKHAGNEVGENSKDQPIP